MASHSLTGSSSNANTGKDARPQIDPAKMNEIFSKLFTHPIQNPLYNFTTTHYSIHYTVEAQYNGVLETIKISLPCYIHVLPKCWRHTCPSSILQSFSFALWLLLIISPSFSLQFFLGGGGGDLFVFLFFFFFLHFPSPLHLFTIQVGFVRLFKT